MFSYDLRTSPWHYYTLGYFARNIWSEYHIHSDYLIPPESWKGKKHIYCWNSGDQTWNEAVLLTFREMDNYDIHLKEWEAERKRAFAMGSHRRLGSDSPVYLLDPHLIKLVLEVYYWH